MIGRPISSAIGSRIGKPMGGFDAPANGADQPDNILTLDNGDLLVDDDGNYLENA